MKPKLIHCLTLVLSGNGDAVVINPNSLDGGTMEAFRKAEALPQVKKRDYELRALVIPAVNFDAVWLQAESDDILIPLPPTIRRFGDYQPYSESQVIEVLKKDAVNMMKQPILPR